MPRDLKDMSYEELKDKIDKMSHYEMCRLWRFAPSGCPYLDTKNPISEYFTNRLFKELGGFTPEISKRLEEAPYSG